MPETVPAQCRLATSGRTGNYQRRSWRELLGAGHGRWGCQHSSLPSHPARGAVHKNRTRFSPARTAGRVVAKPPTHVAFHHHPPHHPTSAPVRFSEQLSRAPSPEWTKSMNGSRLVSAIPISHTFFFPRAPCDGLPRLPGRLCRQPTFRPSAAAVGSFYRWHAAIPFRLTPSGPFKIRGRGAED